MFYFSFPSSCIVGCVQSLDPESSIRANLITFCRLILTCNTVLPTVDEDTQGMSLESIASVVRLALDFLLLMTFLYFCFAFFHFFLCFCCLPPSQTETVYESQSPDEAALLYGLRVSGMQLVERTRTNVRIVIQGGFECFAVMVWKSARTLLQNLSLKFVPLRDSPFSLFPSNFFF
jgi:hypothetical protein